jgi:hypothetical protein
MRLGASALSLSTTPSCSRSGHEQNLDRESDENGEAGERGKDQERAGAHGPKIPVETNAAGNASVVALRGAMYRTPLPFQCRRPQAVTARLAIQPF